MFKSGDKAVCIKKGEWKNILSGKFGTLGPKYNEIVCVDGTAKSGNEEFLYIVGYHVFTDCGLRKRYASKHFRKIHDAETGTVSTKILEHPKVQHRQSPIMPGVPIECPDQEH